jgi:aspartate kinase
MKGISVYKFGGGCFLDLADYRRVAGDLASQFRSTGQRIVVVVSAMSGTTGNLKRALSEVADTPPAHATDAALATGETLSVALLHGALADQNVSAVGLGAAELGIHTDASFGQAKVRRVDTRGLLEALDAHDVVVVPGGQGIDPSGRITMLGRNSSDFTAILLADSLDVPTCNIVSDVAGVFSADPYLVPEAQLLETVAHTTVYAASVSGAKVLHYRSVAHAAAHGLDIACRGVTAQRHGTLVTGTRSPGMVVFCETAAKLRPAGSADGDTLRAALDDLGMPFVELDASDGFSVAVMVDQAEAVSGLQQRLGFDQIELAWVPAVSVHDADGGVRRHWCADREEAVMLLRHEHAQLYPNGLPIAKEAAPKKRSAHSSILCC